jgi:hypothetical protein
VYAGAAGAKVGPALGERPQLTIVIPTRDRPRLLPEAVESALAQPAEACVQVVDDGSEPPASLPHDPRLALVRHPRPRGVSAARNLGTSLAGTPLVSFLDDDDRLRPRFAERSLEALAAAAAPEPVAVLSGVAVVAADGRVLEERLPPTLCPRGRHFSLEPAEAGRSYYCKQTLVVPREVLLGVGGFDERLRSRVHTELFWRLNPACSLVGVDAFEYELRAHAGPRLSTHGSRRRSLRRLVELHRELLEAHPAGYADLLAAEAHTSWGQRQRLAALAAALRLARLAPRATAAAAAARLGKH